MPKSDLIDKLKALSGSDTRPAAARMRDYIQQIEDALSSGVRRADVVAALNDSGIQITLKNFEQTLYRERRKAAERAYIPGGATETARKNEHKPDAPKTVQTPVKSLTQSLSDKIRSSHDPFADD